MDTTTMIETLVEYARIRLPYGDYVLMQRAANRMLRSLKKHDVDQSELPYITYDIAHNRKQVLYQEENNGLAWCPDCSRVYTEYYTATEVKTDYHDGIRHFGQVEMECAVCRKNRLS